MDRWRTISITNLQTKRRRVGEWGESQYCNLQKQKSDPKFAAFDHQYSASYSFRQANLIWTSPRVFHPMFCLPYITDREHVFHQCNEKSTRQKQQAHVIYPALSGIRVFEVQKAFLIFGGQMYDRQPFGNIKEGILYIHFKFSFWKAVQ